MKTKLFSFAVLAFLLTLSFSCKKNSSNDPEFPGDEAGGTGTTTYAGETMTVYLATYGIYDNGRISLNFRNEETELDTRFGFSTTTKQSSLPTGTFQMNKAVNGITFDRGQVKSISFTDGSITISKNGNVYTMNFTFKTGVNEGSGNYKGTLVDLQNL